jgi:hypothetical protein
MVQRTMADVEGVNLNDMLDELNVRDASGITVKFQMLRNGERIPADFIGGNRVGSEIHLTIQDPTE